MELMATAILRLRREPRASRRAQLARRHSRFQVAAQQAREQARRTELRRPRAASAPLLAAQQALLPQGHYSPAASRFVAPLPAAREQARALLHLVSATLPA